MLFTNRLIFFLIFCIIFFSSLFPFQYFGFGLNVYIGLSVMVLATLTFLINRNVLTISKEIKVVLTTFVFVWFLSSFSAVDFSLSTVRFSYYLFTGLAVFYILIVNVKNVKYVEYFNNLLIVLCVLVSIYGIVEFAVNRNLFYTTVLNRENFLYFKLLRGGAGFSDSGRIVSTVGHPVTLGFFLVPGVLLMAHRFIHRMTIFHFTIIVILVTGLFLTFTRGSWIAVFVSLFLFFVKKKADVFKFGVFIILLLGVFIFFSGEVRNTLLTRNPMSYIQNPVEKNRIGSYLTVSKIVTDFPLFGIGTANFRIRRFEYDEFQTVIEGPDNLYLMILAENGIIGFAAFVILLYTIFNKINKRLEETKSKIIRGHLEIYKLIFIAFMINFFFFDALYHPVPRIMFWSILGIMSSLSLRSDEELMTK